MVVKDLPFQTFLLRVFANSQCVKLKYNLPITKIRIILIISKMTHNINDEKKRTLCVLKSQELERSKMNTGVLEE